MWPCANWWQSARTALQIKPPKGGAGVPSRRDGRYTPPRARSARRTSNNDFVQATPVPAAPFELREDGSIGAPVSDPARSQAKLHRAGPEDGAPIRLTFSSDTPFVRLYHGNCLELLDAIAAKYPEGRFDAIFADPPYFLSNGGITCHAGRMVKVDKGDWDKSRGPELNHEFNLEWLARCQRVLKPNGTIWVSGTHHVIFSIGYETINGSGYAEIKLCSYGALTHPLFSIRSLHGHALLWRQPPEYSMSLYQA